MRQGTVMQLVPLAVRILPGQTHPIALAMRRPIVEYNPYFDASPVTPTTVDAVELIVQFAVERAETVVQRVPWGDDQHVSVLGTGSIHRPDSQFVRARASIPSEAVRCVVGDFARIAPRNVPGQVLGESN